MGRPVNKQRRRDRQDAFLKAFAQTGIIGKAADLSGVVFTQHHRWMKEDPEYAERFAELKKETAVLAQENRKKPGPREGFRHSGNARGERQRDSQERFLAALRKTGILKDASRETGVPVETNNYWRRSDPDYAQRLGEILAETTELREQLITQRRHQTAVEWSPERRASWSKYQKQRWTSELRDAAGSRMRSRMTDPDVKESWLAKQRKLREFKACGNPGYFDRIDTPEKAYWLGFIAADGCVTGFKSGSLRLVIKLARKDRAHLDILHEALGAKRPIRDDEQFSKGQVRPYSTLDVCSPQLVNALVSHGITARKTDSLEPWNGPAHLMRHYWRGVIDGDGTIGVYDGEAKLGVCGSRPLVEAFLEWSRPISETMAQVRQGTQGNRRYWTAQLGGNQRLKPLLFELYGSALVALGRKKAIADLIVHGKPLE